MIEDIDGTSSSQRLKLSGIGFWVEGRGGEETPNGIILKPAETVEIVRDSLRVIGVTTTYGYGVFMIEYKENHSKKVVGRPVTKYELLD